MSKVVIVIPTYNEVGNIKRLLNTFDAVKPLLPRSWKLQLLFVDDNSPDGTAAKIEQCMRGRTNRVKLTTDEVVVYRHPQKQGLGKAYVDGMEYAYAVLGADAIGQFDADLSHDAFKIPEMLTKLDQGYGMVIGSRYVTGGSIPANWGWHRKLLSLVGNTIVRFGLGYPSIHDWSTGFRIFSQEVYRRIRRQIADEMFFGYLIMVGMVHIAVRAKAKICEVPFAFVDRTYGESKLGVDYILHTLRYVGRQRLSLIKREVLAWLPTELVGSSSK